MSETASPTVKLAVALAAIWLVLAGPAWIVGEATALVGLSLAAWLCFLPHLLTATFVYVFQPQERPLAGLLLAMATRLTVVLAGALVICWQRPEFRDAAFLVWLAPCYFMALAVETKLMLAKAALPTRPELINGSSRTRTAIGG